MLQKGDKKKEQAYAVNKERTERIRKKAASAATNQESVAAELKNREHGNEQPVR